MSNVLQRIRSQFGKGTIRQSENEKQRTRIIDNHTVKLKELSTKARQNANAIFVQPTPPEGMIKPSPAEIVHGMREVEAIFLNGQPAPLEEMIKPSPSDILHVGTPHQGSTPHSGRFPYGSGEHPYQHRDWFRGFGENAGDYYERYKGKFNDCVNGLMKEEGYTKKQIAEMLGITVKDLDGKISLSKSQFMAYQKAEACRIKNADPTMPNTEIAKILGCSEGTVRNFFKEGDEYLKRANAVMGLVDDLKARVDQYGYVDVSEGNETNIGVTQSRLQTAAQICKEQGYALETIGVEQNFNPDQKTTTLVLAKPGETKGSIYKNMEKIVPAFDNPLNKDQDYVIGMEHKPANLDSSRIHVVYDEEGGSLRDGLVLLRRGVEDLNLGDSNYAQVRIAVDGTHYIKGMAAYGDDSQFPAGKDIIVYSNKHLGTPLTADDPNAKTVLKPMQRTTEGEIDTKNPFGAAIKLNGQSFMKDANGNDILDENGNPRLRVINKVNEEGDWAKWSKTISSQMLSKQPVEIAEKQLDLALQKRQAEYDQIMQVTNPIVKQKLLTDFADACDTDAVKLKAQGFDRQQTHAILPLPNMAENQVYAPNYKDGEHVILIRFPHEIVNAIPYLTVNNKQNPEGDSMIGKNAKDAIGIHPKVATQLSGADYDGDTVLVIPADGHNFNYKKAIPDLIEFDGVKKEMYKAYDGMPKMTKRQRGIEMGKVTNLINDMGQAGAPPDEIVRAIKHSQVVIDAYKHNLDYKKSYVDQGIAELEKRYQPKPNGRHGGASTLISRAGGVVQGLPERKEGDYLRDKSGNVIINPKTGKGTWAFIDPETGAKLYHETGRTKHSKEYTDKNGKFHPETDKLITRKSTRMAEADTPEKVRALMSNNGIGTPMEQAYANYAIRCKQMGNTARKSSLGVNTKDYKQDPVAAKKYAPQVQSVKDKINSAVAQAPRQRQATRLANYLYKEGIKRQPQIKEDEDDVKKFRKECMHTARRMANVGSTRLVLTDKEKEAMEAGAFNKTTLSTILTRAQGGDISSIYMPTSSKPTISSGMKAQIKAMASTGGATNAEIADFFGISTSSVSDIISA